MIAQAEVLGARIGLQQACEARRATQQRVRLVCFPAELLRQPELLAMVLPVLRADLALADCQ